MHKTSRSFFCRLINVSLLLFITATISACEQPDRQFDYSIFSFGTIIDITIYDTDKALAETAFDQLQTDFDRYHQDWSPWTDGDLASLNKKLKIQASVSIPQHLIPIIKASIELSRQSEDYYNPTIGNLINIWQFHKYQDIDIRPPQAEQIRHLIQQNPKMSDLSIISTKENGSQLISKNTAVSLNFGAFAKGYAIALELDKLKKMGIHNAVINAGGDLSVIGKVKGRSVAKNKQGTNERAWNIGIHHPRKNVLLASVQANDNESVFTSGDYERFYLYQEKRYHHILDPATGYPTQDIQSATVIHTDAGRADAAATALLVAGRKNWQRVAKNMGIEYVMLVDSENNIHLTSKMAERVKFLDKSSTLHKIVSEPL